MYVRSVTAAQDYEDMHRLVDRLTPDHLRELRTYALRLVECEETAPGDGEADEERVPGKLSFIGIMNSGERDLSVRHEEILRCFSNHWLRGRGMRRGL
jgi:hypothetical protein